MYMQMMVIIGIPREEEGQVQDSSSVTRNFGDDKALDVAALVVVTAAENLLQLSGEGYHKKRKVNAYRELGDNGKENFYESEAEEGYDSSDRSVTSRVIIEEIFGKEGGEKADEVETETRVGPSCNKKRKFRSLKNLYEVTRPLKTRRLSLEHQSTEIRKKEQFRRTLQTMDDEFRF